jgi:hypothetical protein
MPLRVRPTASDRFLVLLSGALVAAGASIAPAAPTTAAAASALSVSLGGTAITIQGDALAGLGAFDLAPAGMTVSTASATARDPYREVTVTAVPYGTVDEDDPGLGPAYPGAAPTARASLQAYRVSQGASSLGTPQAQLFGATVSGQANLLELAVNGATPSPVAVSEWVTEEGGGLWLLRVAEEVGAAGTASALQPVVAEEASIAVTLGDSAPTGAYQSYQPNSSAPATTGPATDFPGPTAAGAAPGGVGGAVPLPSWWEGMCDTGDYAAAARNLTGNAIPAYPLSASAVWAGGLVACGPRPEYGEGPDVSLRFPGAQWGVLEWECVELSMRWMYEAWGVDPFPANGSGVVWNYASTQGQFNPDGPSLEAIANTGIGPMPVPGDVLSYGATSTAGHTSVVTGVDIDTAGDGTVTVLEENASPTGWDTVSVSHWILGGFDGGVTGWLHNPAFRLSGGTQAEPPVHPGVEALPPG